MELVRRIEREIIVESEEEFICLCVCVCERERERERERELGRKEIFSRPGLNQKCENSFAKK